MTARRYIVILLTLVAVALEVPAQMKWSQNFQNYIDQYKDIAIQEMLRYNIPASITLAQGIFESAAGQSDLCRNGNNHFGIKCHGWTGRKVYHDDDATQECFRAYDTAFESYEDHSKFLSTSQRYSRLFQLKRTDYKGWARGLKECGYATNPQYADKLIQLIELYKLHEYDKATRVTGTSASDKQSKKTADGDHTLHINNRNVCLYARQGDTFKSLSRETGISARKLARYNERGRKDVLAEGDVVYLKKKRTRADKAFKNRPHTVKSGESMYQIAQLYGIRLKSLYEKNRLSADYQLRVGDRLKVY